MHKHFAMQYLWLKEDRKLLDTGDYKKLCSHDDSLQYKVAQNKQISWSWTKEQKEWFFVESDIDYT